MDGAASGPAPSQEPAEPAPPGAAAVGGELSDYEQQRDVNIRRNHLRLASLGLAGSPSLAQSARPSGRAPNSKRKSTLGLPRGEHSPGRAGEEKLLLRELGCLAQVFPHLVSPPRLAQVAPQEKRRAVSCRSGGASRARARRRLPVAARAGTGASVADATFLVGISSRRSIGASSAPLAPSPPAEVVFWCSPTACPATALDARNPFVQVACCGAPRSRRVLTPDAHPGCARSARVRRSSSATTTASTQWSTQ